ncbi:iron ABC transporter permease [Ulvibacterium sp.]|uniref:FecCD family ABC transporter permease n=1 Tax=Ulvibacterium sp. TaxID=2665914 RepID=UPI0026022687|nr:iron ABC transporter permease [Ulvibacterium sp.]
MEVKYQAQKQSNKGIGPAKETDAVLPVTVRLPARARMFLFPILIIGILILILLELGVGTVAIDFKGIIAALFGLEGADPTHSTIIKELRMPRTIAAGIGGAALGTAGLQLQTMFRNPLAGPWALGLTAGAQLGVALVVTTAAVVGSSFLENLEILSNLGIVAGAMLGCLLVLLLMVFVARYVSTITLLIFGLMLGYFSLGLISAILHFTNQSQAKVFAGWNDGSFAGVYWEHFPVLIPLTIIGLISGWLMAKPLNAFLLGENYARALGMSVKRTRIVTLGSAVLLAAPTTAYCGPVLFLGLIVPHLARGLFSTSDHRILIPAVMLLGCLVAMAADLFVHLPWERHFLHLNAVNALIGAPVVMWVLLRNRKMRTFEL